MLVNCVHVNVTHARLRTVPIVRSDAKVVTAYVVTTEVKSQRQVPKKVMKIIDPSQNQDLDGYAQELITSRKNAMWCARNKPGKWTVSEEFMKKENLGTFPELVVYDKDGTLVNTL
eukprot:GHVU01146156.1.p2 GENE.GHVU01146156.1~~GHVU01146156.1.p2  ORF type:complete len:116 (+),score=11.61 GHVU01146156.1:782-1129(+)